MLKKLEILGDAAKYDVSCSSSGGTRQNKPGGIGNSYAAGICHSWSADGRCISLLKVLQSNACVYDCAYCQNRASSDTPRAAFSPDEMAALTMEFYKRNYIEGLFLSSGVIKNPDYTTELMLKTLQLLRQRENFNGYIHVKVIPGAAPELVRGLGLLADRVSVNIELPTSGSLKLLAPQKDAEGILRPMENIKLAGKENLEDRKKFRGAPVFAPAGQSTQMIVGATPESDNTILRLSKGLYKKYGMKRVYYSAYMPVGKHPALPGAAAPLLREHRLYQADWLMRFYHFDAEEILPETSPNLDMELDPKCAWALRNLHLFPVEVNTADYETLLRVPGIGIISARRIVQARRAKRLRPDDLKKLGVTVKRALYFVTADGKFAGRVRPDNPFLEYMLKDVKGDCGQMSLFDGNYTGLPALPAAVM